VKEEGQGKEQKEETGSYALAVRCFSQYYSIQKKQLKYPRKKWLRNGCILRFWNTIVS
jgi:hypothetical protein